MRLFIFFIPFILLVNQCNSQSVKDTKNKLVGGPCEGCEAVLEYGNKPLSSIITLPGFEEHEPKIKATGTVYQIDGKTPAANVILYVYHTNREGIYEPEDGAKGWAARHGQYKGWLKTDEQGQYTFYTFRPAPYPTGTEEEHIHLMVKEPGKNEYYMDSFIFNDDPMLTTARRQKKTNRGGSGITYPKMEEGILTIKRDIILGLNIENYSTQ